MIPNRIFHLIALLILSLPSLHGQKLDNDAILGFRMPEGKTSFTIPFELIDNLVVVKVIMNRTLPLKFIIDTGVRTSILTEKTFTDLLNINYSRRIEIPVPGTQNFVDAFIAPNITLDINGLIGKGHAILVLEEDLLELKNILGHNVQGILGYELFSRFIIEINYQNQVMTLYTLKGFEKKNIANNKRFKRIPITIEDTKPYCIADIVQKNGTYISAKLMLDTGASHSILLIKESSTLIDLPEKRVYSHLGRGLGGDIKGYIGRVESLHLADFHFNDIITTYPEPQFYDQDTVKVYRNGTLGGGIFSRFRIVFDFIHGYVYLKKNKKYKKPFEYNLSGVVIKAKGLYLNTFEIISVRENSTAHSSGIEAGDMIVRINGQPTHNMQLDEVHSILNSKPNRVLRLELDRDGEYLVRKFRLERVI